MKIIKYTVERSKVWMNLYDKELDLIVNFKCIYSGKSNEDCKTWLKGYLNEKKKNRN